MKVELDKKGLATLVRGISPSYEKMENPKVAACGHFVGGFKDEWNWHHDFEKKMTEKQLWELYQILTK